MDVLFKFEAGYGGELIIKKKIEICGAGEGEKTKENGEESAY